MKRMGIVPVRGTARALCGAALAIGVPAAAQLAVKEQVRPSTSGPVEALVERPAPPVEAPRARRPAAREPNEQVLQGELTRRSPKSDDKYYQVHTATLEAGKRYAIGAETDAFDPVLRVSFADDNDEQLAEDDDGGEGRNSYLEFTPGRSGTYRLRVTALGDDTGRYLIRLAELAPLPRPLRPSAEGTSTMTFRHYSGRLSPSDGEVKGHRVKDYLFRLEAGKRVILSMDSDDDIDPMLEIYSLSRNGSEPVARNDDGGDGTNALIVFVPEQTGDYLVRATTVGDEDAVGAFTLKLGQEP